MFRGRPKGYRSFLLLALLAAGCAGLPTEPPLLTIVSIVREDATGLEQQYLVRLRVENPNPQDLQVKGLRYTLELSDKPFLTGVANEPFTIPRKSKGEIQVLGFGVLPEFAPPVQTLNHSRTGLVPYRLTGTLDLGGLPQLSNTQTPTLVFSNTGAIPLPPGISTDYGAQD